jgi:hypothetical protein
MRRLALILSGLLMIQVAGAVALSLSGPDYGAFEANKSLVAFDPEAVKEVMIEGEDGEAVVLQRQDDEWVLPDLYGFPADGTKAAGLVKKVAALTRGLPIAVSDTAAKRFKVAEDTYKRRIVLSGDDGRLGEILIGTSPSYRYVHARTSEEEAVYSVQFATYEAGTKPTEWMDRDLLHVAEDEIERIVLPSVTLVRQDGGFALEGLAENEAADEEAIDSLVGKVARLTFASVEGKGEEALARVGEPESTLEVDRKDGPMVTYRLSKMTGRDDYLLAASTEDYLFRVADYVVKPLLEASREKLIKKPAEEGKSGKPSLSEKPKGVDDGSG